MKKSALKSFIKEEIKTTLQTTTEATSDEVENQRDLNRELDKTADLTDKIRGDELNEDEDSNKNLGLAVYNGNGIKAGQAAVKKAKFPTTNKPDFDAYSDGFLAGVIGEIDTLKEEDSFEGESSSTEMNEMAKLSGDLKSKVDSLIKSNPDMEGGDLKKLIRKDAEIVTGLEGAKLHDTQLNKLIALHRGERTISKRGPRVDPNKPKKTPTKKKKASDTRKGPAALGTTSLGGKKYYTSKIDDEEGPSDMALRKLAKTKHGKAASKDKSKALQTQEKQKMIKAFLADMRKEGIVDNANRIVDKEKYAAAWNAAKPGIEAKAKAVR